MSLANVSNLFNFKYATPGTHRFQERGYLPELQMAVSCHVRAENLPLKEPSDIMTAEPPL